MSTDNNAAAATSSTTSYSALQQALFSRLDERHAQTRSSASGDSSSQSARAQQDKVGADFLPQFAEMKDAVTNDLNALSDRHQNDAPVPAHELTRIMDNILVRIEEMRKNLNESSLYLTAYDSEHARLQLKELHNLFQSKREQLLPVKKFSFSRTKPSPSRQPTNPPEPTTTARVPISASSLSQFDERFSWTGISGPRVLQLPKSDDDKSPLRDQSVYLADLTDCTVCVNAVCGNLVARRLTRCRLQAAVASSVWLEDCARCDLVLACQQLRVHRTRDCRLALHVTSRPIIEDSTALSVAPSAVWRGRRAEDLSTAGLRANVNLWSEVEDFSHPNKRLTTGSPNWHPLPEAQWEEAD